MKTWLKVFLAISISCLLVVLFVIAKNLDTSTSSQPETVEQPRDPITRESLLAQVNRERAKIDVAPLSIDMNVEKSAQLKADDMFKRNYREHKMPGTDQVINTEMNELLVASCSDSSENFVYGYDTSQGAMNEWMNSPPHRAAILDPKYTTTGFGISGSVVVQHFCVAS